MSSIKTSRALLGGMAITILLIGTAATPAPPRPDPCADKQLVLCLGGGTASPIASKPPVVRTPLVGTNQLGSPNVKAPSGEVAAQSVLVGPNTCRYFDTGYTDGSVTGNGLSGAGATLEALAASSDSQPFVFSLTGSSSALADVGVQVLLTSNWPQPSSVDVTYPWHARARLETDTSTSPIPFIGGTSTAEANYDLSVVLAQGNAEAAQKVVDEKLAGRGAPGGPSSKDVIKDGNKTLNVATPANQTYRAFLRAEAETTATSVVGASARGFTDGFDLRVGRKAWTDFQDWKFNLPAGFNIASC